MIDPYGDAPEKALSEMLQSRMVPMHTQVETVRFLRKELHECPCEDLCSECALMYRWLRKLDPTFGMKPHFRIIPGGKA